jgi:hypothetical protein
MKHGKKKLTSVAFSPQANYTDQATAKLVQIFADKGCRVVGATVHHGR